MLVNRQACVNSQRRYTVIILGLITIDTTLILEHVYVLIYIYDHSALTVHNILSIYTYLTCTFSLEQIEIHIQDVAILFSLSKEH